MQLMMTGLPSNVRYGSAMRGWRLNGMDSLQDILGQKNFKPPDEISAIKDYIKRNYKSGCRIRVEKQTIILSVPSSGLAGTLQLEKQQLIDSCGLSKKLIIRTGS